MRNDPEPLGKISQSKICGVCGVLKAVWKHFKYALLIPSLVEARGLTYSCSSQITQSLTMLKNVSGFRKNFETPLYTPHTPHFGGFKNEC